MDTFLWSNNLSPDISSVDVILFKKTIIIIHSDANHNNRPFLWTPEPFTFYANEFFNKHRLSNFLNVELWIFSYPSVQTFVLGAQRNRLIETVLLSTHNICSGWEIRKLIFTYNCAFLSIKNLFFLLKISKHREYSQSISYSSLARGYKTFSCSTQLSMKFIMLINVKMPTIDILTFISMINTT